MEDHIAAGAPDQNDLGARGPRSSVPSRIPTHMSVTLQRGNTVVLHTYRADCLHAANATAPVPFRYRREWKKPVSALSPTGAEEGRAMPGDADVATSLSAAVQGKKRGHKSQPPLPFTSSPRPHPTARSHQPHCQQR